MAEFNIIGKHFDPNVDLKLFFTDEEISSGNLDVPLTLLEESDRTLAHLFHRLGKFQSVGEAKKNGWDKPIPTGWNHFTIGKNNKRWDFFLWNPERNLTDFAIHERAKKHGMTDDEWLEWYGNVFMKKTASLLSDVDTFFDDTIGDDDNHV